MIYFKSFPPLLSCQLSIMMGAAAGFSAILLAQWDRDNSSKRLTAEQTSWLASSGLICRPIGVMVEGYIVDKFGRKTAMQIVAFFFIISWLCTALSNSFSILLASRMFLGFTLGMVICVGLYIAEITTPADRGTYLSVITPSTNLGVLLVYLLGWMFHWKVVALILATYCALILIFLYYVPESPIWYMLKQRKTEATKVLLRFRNNDAEVVQTELNEIRKRLRQYEQSEGFKSYLKNFTSPAAWKPLVIFTVFSILQQQAGYNIIVYYAVAFFGALVPGAEQKEQHKRSIIFASVSLVGSLLLVTIVHKFNRVTLLVTSGIFMSMTIFLGAYFRSNSITEVADGYSDTLPVFCVYAYIFFCMLGMIDIPWMMIGEILPNHLRGVMSAMITVIIFFMSFLNVKLYTLMVGYLGIAGVLCVFGVFSLFSVLFAKLFFPETRGKALYEVEEFFLK